MPSRHRTSVHLLNNRLNYLFQILLDDWLPWLVLPILVLYTYLEIVHAPYIGFSFSPSRGVVQTIWVDAPGYNLRANDLIVSVDGVGWHAEQVQFHNTLLSYLQTDDLLNLEIERAGEKHFVTWRVPGVNAQEFVNRVFNVWILGYVFWLAGMATTLLIRPRDTRSRLFTAFFVLTALWLVAGNTGRWNLWNSTNLFRSAIWLCVPVYLHLHWLIPKELIPLPTAFWRTFYGLAGIIAIAQWVEVLPRNLYGVGLLVALAGSALLLIFHFVYQPEQRGQIRFLTFAIIFAIIPLIGLGIVSALGHIPPEALLALGALPLIPIAYFYTIYRHQVGGLEFRANQLLSIYLFLLLLTSVLVVLFTLISFLPQWVSKELLAGVTLSLSAALVGIYGFPQFKRFIESRLLGISLPSTQLLETYTARITTSLTFDDLAYLLEQEILPSLMIRQSALLLVQGTQLTQIYVSGIDETLLPTQVDAVNDLGTANVVFPPRYFPDTTNAIPSLPPKQWVSALIPLRFEGQLIGVWLFGRRDPDDQYNAAELPILQTLAHQTAIAIVNIEQSRQLRALYDANIDRHEIERTHLAHELHDDILGGLSVLKATVRDGGSAERFDKAYQTVRQRIIHMITGLRPAMLNYGLYAALDELVDDLNDRANQIPLDESMDLVTGWPTVVSLEIEPARISLPLKVEEYLFRIVQQACENALRHAKARTIRVIGDITSDIVDLTIVDDGVGIDLAEGLSVADLLVHKHFGLVGMIERAKSVGAELTLASQPNQGTSVRLVWKPHQLLKNVQ